MVMSVESRTAPGADQGPVGALRAGRAARARVAAFTRDEDGGVFIVFAFYVLTIMLMVGGLGVDLMRYEAERSRVQNTADRASLAAASLRQDLSPYAVVADYFAKADLSANHAGTIVDQGLNYRRVDALTELSVPTMFMRLMGINTLASEGSGAAIERRTNVEIALVLDISGSMEVTPSRIVNLRNAANEFVEKLLDDDTENRVSISVVPYNGQVNIGPDLMNLYNITDRHNTTNSHCVDLPPSAYNTLALSRNLPMPQHVHADTYNSSNTSSSYSTTNMTPSNANRWCVTSANNRIRVHSNNKTALTTQITNLEAVGATSIDAGLRWGSALLDPGTRSVVSDLVAINAVPAHFNGRPFDYDDPETLKVIVLMTDGEHWPNEHVNDGFRSGPSTVFKNSADNRYSIHHAHVAGAAKYWIPHTGTWAEVPWGGTVTETCTGSWWNTVCTTTHSNGTAVQLDWRQVWAELRVQWAAQHLYRRALGGTLASWVDHLRTREGVLNAFGSGNHNVNAMNARLLNLCTLVKQQNVVIFGIAFEAPPGGVEVIRNCATENRFHDVAGLEINTAFRQIRSQISSLRLTQ